MANITKKELMHLLLFGKPKVPPIISKYNIRYVEHKTETTMEGERNLVLVLERENLRWGVRLRTRKSLSELSIYSLGYICNEIRKLMPGCNGLMNDYAKLVNLAKSSTESMLDEEPEYDTIEQSF